MSGPPLSTAPGDTPLRRWGRRALTVPGYLVALVAAAALYLLALVPVLALDLALRRRLAAVRFLTAVLVYLAFENFGVAWIAGLFLTGRATQDRLFRLECLWASAMLGLLLRLFGMKLEVRGLEAARPGPMVVMGNHTSVADVLIPATLVSARQGIRLRYVAKLELIWDPCVDLAGHLLPNVFVRRGSADTPGDVARVQRLLEGLGPEDGIFIYPEGTRHTPERREEVLRARAAEGAPRLGRDRALRHLLPPRLGGVLGLFEKNPGADVLLFGQVGLEGVRRIPDLWNGVLIGRTMRVEFWRRAWSEVPQHLEGRIEWLYQEWERLDDWLERQKGPLAAGAVGR
ncbi:MAG TPA: 1-acyl-sn-glycerol-3-phosphate acyltransferase [Anaeromyxobacteraceae bacterium]|nr:1-acyl-sn-glycerol-3-phosphate acyltransferase [Anaeromyxobacteraceae bacterium]